MLVLLAVSSALLWQKLHKLNVCICFNVHKSSTVKRVNASFCMHIQHYYCKTVSEHIYTQHGPYIYIVEVKHDWYLIKTAKCPEHNSTQRNGYMHSTCC